MLSALVQAPCILKVLEVLEPPSSFFTLVLRCPDLREARHSLSGCRAGRAMLALFGRKPEPANVLDALANTELDRVTHPVLQQAFAALKLDIELPFDMGHHDHRQSVTECFELRRA